MTESLTSCAVRNPLKAERVQQSRRVKEKLSQNHVGRDSVALQLWIILQSHQLNESGNGGQSESLKLNLQLSSCERLKLYRQTQSSANTSVP